MPIPMAVLNNNTPVPVEWYIDLAPQAGQPIEDAHLPEPTDRVHDPSGLLYISDEASDEATANVHWRPGDPVTAAGFQEVTLPEANVGADWFVVIRTSEQINYRARWTMGMKHDPASSVGDPIDMQGDGLNISQWRGYRARLPILFDDLSAAANNEITDNSAPTSLIGVNIFDGNPTLALPQDQQFRVERQDETLEAITVQIWNSTVTEGVTAGQVTPDDFLPIRFNGIDDDGDGEIDELDELGVTIWRDADGNGVFDPANDFPVPISGAEDWNTEWYPFWTRLTIANLTDNRTSVLNTVPLSEGVAATGSLAGEVFYLVI